MTKAEKIDKLRNLTKAYILYSACTKLPYVECEQGSYYDQVFMFETEADAKEAANRIAENGDPVGMAELKTVQMALSEKEISEGATKGLFRNQVREHLMRLPLLGVNAVFFKPEGDRGEVLELDALLPEEVKSHIDTEKLGLEGVRLTGMYFAQVLRQKKKDMNQLRDFSEEFHANLVRAELLIPVMPPEGEIDATKLDLVKCQLPTYSLKKADTNENHMFLTVFTNMDELIAYCRNNAPKTRVVRIPFDDIPKILRDPMVGCIVDPFSINIPIRKEDILALAAAVKQ